MGCDIHMYVEKRVDGKWEYAIPPYIKATEEDVPDYVKERLPQEPNAVKDYLENWPTKEVSSYHKYYGKHGSKDYDKFIAEAKTDEERQQLIEEKLEASEKTVPWGCGGRDYGLFGVIGRVRWDAPNPFPADRGVPDDSCLEIKKASQDWGGDGHSHNYLTLTEVLNYPWDTEFMEAEDRWVDSENYKRFKEGDTKGLKAHWGPPSRSHRVSNEQMETLLAAPEQAQRVANALVNDYYTQISYSVPYRERFKAFIGEFIGHVKQLSENTDDVRLVFWFDN